MFDKFVNARKNNWQRLEDLLSLVENSSLRGLNREEVRELGTLYRRVATDLSIARAESRDDKLVNYLNSLVTRAHGKIYRADNSGANSLWKFVAQDFPVTFRKTWRYTAVSFAVFTIFAIVGFVGTWYDADFSIVAGVSQRFRTLSIETETQWWLGLNDNNQAGAAGILTNNIYVSFLAFAYGAFFGIGSLFIEASNGSSIGSILALCYLENTNFGNSLLTFMVAHGVIELSCIFIAGGAGLLIGTAVLLPGDLSRIEALKFRGLEAIRLVIGCAILLFFAGIIEGFISPAPIEPIFKYAIAILTGVAMYSYLLFVGKSDLQ
ncbi:MAG: stage II sporulation protein M [Pyrinomonadaceae bacterium]|nr:stage II sporulation protein M [Pyrinomonadaceae bacterium]